MNRAPDNPLTMPLSVLMEDFCQLPEMPQMMVRGMALDSRRVNEGDLFLAVAGHSGHGLSFAEEAVRRGALAILYEPVSGGLSSQSGTWQVPCLPVEGLNQRVGQIADRFFGHPSTELDVIAVTGTNGKTSCTHFLAQALTDDSEAAGVVGTLGWGVPGHLTPLTQTTPDAVEIHRILAELREDSFTSVAIEASSHGLVQGRLNGVLTKAALFTNITRDHLDYHETEEAYVAAKMRLLDAAGLRVVAFNADDPMTRPISERIQGRFEGVAFSVSGNRLPNCRTLIAERIEHQVDGVRMLLAYGGGEAVLCAPVFGDYNAENLLGCAAVLIGLGYGLKEAASRLGKGRPVPGRMELFGSADGIRVVVDYAHTPDALDRVLWSLKKHCAGKLWAVFGCGGERDRGKRSLMGEVASRWADEVIITDDNPRYEAGDRIVEEILAGCVGKNVHVERDRRLAMESAIMSARTGDIILVAGKGHETVQEIQGTKHPFDDRELARTLLAARRGRN